MLEVVCFDDNYRHSLHDIIEQADIIWHGTQLNKPDWGPDSYSIAVESKHPNCEIESYLIFNAYWMPLTFELPISPSGKWLRMVDTSLTDGKDIYTEGDEKQWVDNEYLAAPRSVVILIGYVTSD